MSAEPNQSNFIEICSKLYSLKQQGQLNSPDLIEVANDFEGAALKIQKANVLSDRLKARVEKLNSYLVAQTRSPVDLSDHIAYRIEELISLLEESYPDGSFDLDFDET